MKYHVGFINESYRRYARAHEKELKAAIWKCYANGEFVLRPELEKFEKNLAKFLRVKYVAGVGSGTDALKIAYRACSDNWENPLPLLGKEVITVSHTFIAPIEEIVNLGGKPVFVDVREDGLMNVEQLVNAITTQTVGIVPVHLSGKVCEMGEIMRIAKERNLWVVEDSCQALGASYKEKMAGTIGDAGCFSFIAPKTLGAGGDGGGIVTNNREIYERVLLLRNHSNITQGVLHGYQPKEPKKMVWGYNSRLDVIHAAALNIKLTKYYHGMLKRRKEICRRYMTELMNLPLKLPTTQEGQIAQEMIIRVPDANAFKKFMDMKRIEVLVRDTVPNHVKYAWTLGQVSLPVTEAMATSCCRLPCYPEMKESEVSAVIKAIREFFKNRPKV